MTNPSFKVLYGVIRTTLLGKPRYKSCASDLQLAPRPAVCIRTGVSISTLSASIRLNAQVLFQPASQDGFLWSVARRTRRLTQRSPQPGRHLERLMGGQPAQVAHISPPKPLGFADQPRPSAHGLPAEQPLPRYPTSHGSMATTNSACGGNGQMAITRRSASEIGRKTYK